MITMDSNGEVVFKTVQAKLTEIDIDKMTRLQATSLMAAMRRRIHIDGLDSDGKQIGIYSPGYLKYVRPKHGRQEGPKVVLSLTRSMENAMVLYPIENGTGIGYTTAEQLQKARWTEETYKKRIFAPTEGEKNMVMEIAKSYIAEHLNG
jgi:hypothetical protein